MSHSFILRKKDEKKTVLGCKWDKLLKELLLDPLSLKNIIVELASMWKYDFCSMNILCEYEKNFQERKYTTEHC